MTSEEDDHEGVYFMGSDLSKIPCFRKSLLSGITGGIASGLLYFLFTSNVKRVGHVGMGAYGVITLGTWTVCRYNYSQELAKREEIHGLMQKRILMEGTDMEREMMAEIKGTESV